MRRYVRSSLLSSVRTDDDDDDAGATSQTLPLLLDLFMCQLVLALLVLLSFCNQQRNSYQSH